MFPTAAGFPQQSGVMIPEVWSSKILVKFYEACVLAHISNTEYEGEIKNVGDVVHIRTTPSITIRKYRKGQKLTYETPEPEIVDLTIDEGRYWAFTDDDVDQHQSDYAYIDNWTRDASSQLKIEIDTDILGSIYTDADADNQGLEAGAKEHNINLGASGGNSVPLTADNIVSVLVDMGTVLDEQNVPEEDRWVVLPPWACGLIQKSDLQDASHSGDGETMVRSGRLGIIARFTIYQSNLLATEMDGGTRVTNIIFGHLSALTFASQLVKNEGPMRAESTFGNLYRGLQVYGCDVIKKKGLGRLYAHNAGVR